MNRSNLSYLDKDGFILLLFLIMAVGLVIAVICYAFFVVNDMIFVISVGTSTAAAAAIAIGMGALFACLERRSDR